MSKVDVRADEDPPSSLLGTLEGVWANRGWLLGGLGHAWRVPKLVLSASHKVLGMSRRTRLRSGPAPGPFLRPSWFKIGLVF